MTTSIAPSPKANALLVILSAHVGRARGVSAAQLASLMNWPAREVRKYVSELRELGHPICARPLTGYFIAETPAEVEEAVAFLHSRAMHSLRLIAQIKRISLPTLMGQMNLKT